MIPSWLAQVAAPAAEAAADPTRALLIACALLALGVALFAIEFVVVSGGILGIGALAAAIASVTYAFTSSQLAGWVFILLVPVLAAVITSAGLRWMARSRLVVHSEITEDAGYHHVLTRSGIGPGSAGTLVTDAYPSGRARFNGTAGAHEVDIQLRGGASAEAGAAVVIKHIEGAVVFCDLDATPSPANAPISEGST